jgi:TolB protein
LAVNSFGPLFVFERETGQFEQLSTEPVIAFFWSPVGDRLLMMRAEFVDQQLWFRLAVWDGESTQELGRFIPSALFLNQVLPFADQYAQSMRFWAPDGSAFVYAGAGEDGRQGIWIQQLSVAKPALVSEGLLASWSPQ